MDIQSYLSIIVGIINLTLGFLVFLKNRKVKANRLFFFITLSITLWIIGLLFLDKEIATLFPERITTIGQRLAFSGASLLALFFALLSLEFPKRDIILPSFIQIGGLIIACFFIFSSVLTDWIFKKGGFIDTKFIPSFGKLLIGFAIYFCVFMFGGVINLFRKYKKSSGIEKQQISYFLLGSFISILIGTTTNLIHPLITGIPSYARFGPISTLFLVIFTALAITRYHLFGIEVILIEILVGVIGILLVVQIFMAQSTLWRIINGIIFALFCVFGYLLIRGVFREIKRREEVEKISKAKTEFLSIASHQLRTPLSIIKGYLSMILEGSYGNLPEKVKKPMENVFVSNERLIRLVNDILNVTKIETGEMEMNLEKTDLREIIKEVISELSLKAKEKNLYLEFEEPKEFPKILLDSEKIRQVILNLVDNAIRYTQKGGVTVKLQIANGRLQIVVSDTGEGLTKEEKEKLFERFSRGTAGTKFWTEGAGLGLYVARRFVEMHNGKIWAESEGKGKGSTFYVELPIR